MHKWLNQHIQAASVVLHRLHLQLLSTILIMTVIGVTLAIPSLIYVMLQNANTLIMDVKKEAKMSVFLQQNASQTTIDAIKTKLGNQSDIEEFTFVSKDTALKQLIETTDNPELIASLEDNPLPHAFFIKPASIDKSALKSLKSNLEQLDGVAEVVVDCSD
jgi:cell division transport system permease protein